MNDLEDLLAEPTEKILETQELAESSFSILPPSVICMKGSKGNYKREQGAKYNALYRAALGSRARIGTCHTIMRLGNMCKLSEGNVDFW